MLAVDSEELVTLTPSGVTQLNEFSSFEPRLNNDKSRV
jgi:hypothetical protein